MDTLERRLCIGFRSRADWTGILDEFLERLVALLSIPEEELTPRLRNLTEGLAELVYVQHLRSLLIQVGDATVSVKFVYDLEEGVEDELDLTPMEFLDWDDVSAIVIQIQVDDLARANYLQSDRLIAMGDPRLTVELVGIGSDQPTPIGKGDTESDVDDDPQSQNGVPRPRRDDEDAVLSRVDLPIPLLSDERARPVVQKGRNGRDRS